MRISRNTLLKTLFGSLFSIPVIGKAQSKNELESFKSDFKLAWISSEKYTLTVFNQMPEDKLEYKYTPESYSFRTQFVHCITFTASQLAGHLEISNPYKEKKNEYWNELSKRELETELKNFYIWVQKEVDKIDIEKLSKTETYVGDIPVWRLFYSMENHIIHHRGQAICYLRLNGITPVGYIGWF